jgi:putative RNA 2'-phosphotransferase
MRHDLVSVSKFLSLVLRHQPETIGITLSSSGWIAINALLDAASRHGRGISRELLDEVVFTNDKQRFAFSDDGLSIRANQGHSVSVDLDLTPQTPPEVLFHGTASRFVEQIRQQGLRPMQRNHVHLSANMDVARRVGARHGQPVVLHVASGKMAHNGFQFFQSANGVWLTDRVDPQYLLREP